LPLRQSGYLPSGRPRYSYTHLDRPPVLAITSPSHARPPTRVGYEEHQRTPKKQNFNGADIPFVSLNEEGRKRRGEDEVEDRSDNRGQLQLANSGSYIDNRYYSKSNDNRKGPIDLDQVVDIQPRDLPSLFARSARGALNEQQRNSTNEWSMTRN